MDSNNSSKNLISQLPDKESILIHQILNPDWKERDQHEMMFYIEWEDEDMPENDKTSIPCMWIECACGLIIGNLQADPSQGGEEAIYECYERLHGGEETLSWRPSLYFQ